MPASITPPHIDPYGWAYATGPGPLSPAWPQAAAPAPPDDDLLALAAELRALRGECIRSLDPDQGTGLLVLGRRERAWLDGALGRLRALNAELPHNRRSAVVARWGEPVLPDGVLFGPRDLISLLDTAARVAGEAAAERQWRREEARAARFAAGGAAVQ
jgi:hypothetical protein